MIELNGEQLILIARYLGAGLAMGLGAIGSAIGIGVAATGALGAIPWKPERQGEFLRTMFIAQAVSESTAIYALVVAMVLLFVVGGGNTDALYGADWVNAVTYLAGGVCMGLGALGAGYGIGYAGKRALEAMLYRPRLRGPLMRTMFVGMAVTESPAIYALVIALILILVIVASGTAPLNGLHLIDMARFLGAGLAMGFGAIGAALGIGITAGKALVGIARQPAKQGSLIRTMFLAMAITESPAIYALVVASILVFVIGALESTSLVAVGSVDLVAFGKFLGGGIAIGLGTVGAGVGLGIAGGGALEGLARNPDKDSALLRTMFLGMAIAESPAIYALVVSLILLFVIGLPLELGWGRALHDFARLLGAGIAMGAGALGPGLGIGIAAERTLTSIARSPKQEGALVRTMFLGMAVTESTAIYSLVIALILLFAIQ